MRLDRLSEPVQERVHIPGLEVSEAGRATRVFGWPGGNVLGDLLDKRVLGEPENHVRWRLVSPGQLGDVGDAHRSEFSRGHRRFDNRLYRRPMAKARMLGRPDTAR